MRRLAFAFLVAVPGIPAPATAQQTLGGPITQQPQGSTTAQPRPASPRDVRPLGRQGQRQTRQDAAPGLETSSRLGGRIQNRVQLRIRNRIDRNYDPQSNAARPFEVAEEQIRAATRNPR